LFTIIKSASYDGLFLREKKAAEGLGRQKRAVSKPDKPSTVL
jgi:hypothetical protein